jgi:hypothetical protein
MATPSPALIPDNEASRLWALNSYKLINTNREPVFEGYVALAAALFNLSICLLSLVDEHQVWFNAGIGMQGLK